MTARVKLLSPQTTSPELAFKSATRWLRHRPNTWLDTELVEGEATAWLATDGSSSGWHSAVLVAPGLKAIHYDVANAPMLGLRNVAAELRAITLGLTESLDQLQPRHLVVIHDYIGISAWLTGAWPVKKPAVQHLVKEICEALRQGPVETVQFVHQPGHAGRLSDFSTLNEIADALCTRAIRTKHGLIPTRKPRLSSATLRWALKALRTELKTRAQGPCTPRSRNYGRV